jgi:hypothetical protein
MDMVEITGRSADLLLKENDHVVLYAWSAISAALFCF